MHYYKKTQPSYSSSLLSFNLYYNWRYTMFVLTALLLFGDMLTTYFALTEFGATEEIAWTQWIINQYGWSGVILRFVLSTILLGYIYKYQPNIVFKYSTPLVLFVLGVYAYFSTINNILIMVR